MTLAPPTPSTGGVGRGKVLRGIRGGGVRGRKVGTPRGERGGRWVFRRRVCAKFTSLCNFITLCAVHQRYEISWTNFCGERGEVLVSHLRNRYRGCVARKSKRTPVGVETRGKGGIWSRSQRAGPWRLCSARRVACWRCLLLEEPYQSIPSVLANSLPSLLDPRTPQAPKISSCPSTHHSMGRWVLAG